MLGTLNNCAGGQTPWGTYLTAEENFHGYFWTDRKAENGRRLTRGLGGAQQKSYDRYGVPCNWYSWGKYHDRFNVDKEANEPQPLRLDRRDRSLRCRARPRSNTRRSAASGTKAPR